MNATTTELSEVHQRLYNAALSHAGGSAVWRRRKGVEARELLLLAQRGDRLRVEMLDLAEALRAVLWLRVPVACRPTEPGRLPLAEFALLGLTYPEEALRSARPGYSFVQVLAPFQPWHANIALGPAQPLCLGASLPAGIRVKELVLMTYGALSMQTVQIDERDPAGVMNPEAARWWQQNLARIPLTREPFFASVSGE
jgi:hypothetical protein